MLNSWLLKESVTQKAKTNTGAELLNTFRHDNQVTETGV